MSARRLTGWESRPSSAPPAASARCAAACCVPNTAASSTPGTCPSPRRRQRSPAMPPDVWDPELFDQVTAMPRDEQMRLLFAICLRVPAEVRAPIDYLRKEGLL